MKPEEIRQLLGGYASGTLSEAEKKLLFDAALEDQVLFDAMADEQALKDLLDDPESRGYLQAVLDEAPSDLEAGRNVPRRTISSVQPASLSSVPYAPVPSQQEISGSPKRRQVPAWWGLLAAAGLAAVSVVGILQFNDHRSTTATEVATAGKPATQPQSIPPPVANPSTPVDESKQAESRPPTGGPAPIPARRTSGGRMIAPPSAARAGSAVHGEPETEKQKENREPAKVNEDRLKDSRPAPTEQASRDQRQAEQANTAAHTVEVQAAPPAPVRVAPSQNSAPLPTPQQNSQSAPAGAEPSFRDALGARAQQDQVQMAKASQPPSTPAPDPAETARQLYFAGQASSTTAQGGGSSGGGAVRKKAGPGSPGIAGGVIGRSPAPAAPRTSGAAANLKTIVPAPQPGFAMRYRLLRKSGTGEFVPVAPDTRFRVGEEVVIAIDKNSGGLAMIRRMAALDSTPIPMAIQTNQLARSVPLTVTGPMELVIVLVPQTNTTVPIGVVEPAPAQKSESADDMVYIAEPASASVQPLVVRIAIRVEQ